MSNEEVIGYVEHGDSAEAVAAEERAFRRQNTRTEAVDQDEDSSLLADFLAAAEEEIGRTETFPIEGRKGDWSAEFDVIISSTEIKRYEAKGLGKKKDRKDAAQHIIAGYALAEKNVAIYRGTGPDRKQVLDSEGDPLTFRSAEFLETQGHPNDSIAAVVKFLGDAQAITLSGAVMREGGWAADLTPLDPTNG